MVEDSTSLKVAFIDSEVVDAAIKGTDAETDLAVIAVPLEQIKDDTKSKIKVARLGNSDELKVGQGVIAIGNALGYGQSVTVGYVSALNRRSGYQAPVPGSFFRPMRPSIPATAEAPFLI